MHSITWNALHMWLMPAGLSGSNGARRYGQQLSWLAPSTFWADQINIFLISSKQEKEIKYSQTSGQSWPWPLLVGAGLGSQWTNMRTLPNTYCRTANFHVQEIFANDSWKFPAREVEKLPYQTSSSLWFAKFSCTRIVCALKPRKFPVAKICWSTVPLAWQSIIINLCSNS